MNLNIVLVEPQIPQNTGNISRTCAVTGARLHLVKPMGFEVTDKNLKRAGLDYWDKLDITYYDSLADFLRKPQAQSITISQPRAKTSTVTLSMRTTAIFFSAGRIKDFPRSFCTIIRMPAFAFQCALS